MSPTRRSFIAAMGAGALSMYSHDLVAQLIADSPRGRAADSRFRGLSDIVLAEARTAGCSYADVRFTFRRNLPGGVAVFGQGGPGGGGGGGGFGGGGGGGGGGDEGVPEPNERQAAGFGVRVIHSGVWGFASSPIVTEDEIRRITRMAVEVARASAIAKKEDVRLTPVDPYVEHYVTPLVINPMDVSETDKQAWAQAIVDAASGVDGVTRVQVAGRPVYEWRYFASSEGSYIEQENYMLTPTLSVTARVGDVTRTRNYPGQAMMGGWEVAANSGLLEAAERVANEAVEMCTAQPLGSPGLRDLILSPSHAMLTIHEIVGHATELDRIVGYEANYAGTSFIKLEDVGRLKYGSEIFNVTADRNSQGLASTGYDDDGVRTTEWPIVRDGILVGLQTNRETAHFVGEDFSRGCTYATTWQQYPFLRMPNVHVDAGPPGSPTWQEMVADVRDGVLIDGRGSYSIDQQRYNGQFGGHAFWEIKNGQITRMVTDVAYNAITTDFWANLDAVSGPDQWEMHGTQGDAKGQPTQSQAVSHGSPWLLVRNIMVGGAYM
ncbi:MAG TPA: TldD/PmbA family protein [Longimicrobiales bacterium]|nr:TldD/PmbA family protein [Longimicrobiales bacterium]